MSLLDGATVVVEVAGAPPVTVSLDPKSEPSPLAQLLRPKVTVKSGDAVLYSSAPYGEPSQGFPVVAVAVLGLLALVAVMVLRL